MIKNHRSLIVLLVTSANLDFVVFLNDLPVYFYWHEEAASEQYIQLNGFLKSQGNVLEIQPLDGEWDAKALDTLNIQLGQVADGEYQGKPLDPKLFSLNKHNERSTLIPAFNAPNAPAHQPWDNAEPLSENNIARVKDYYHSIKALYEAGNIDELIPHFELAFRQKQMAFTGRPPESFEGLLRFELEDELSFDDRKVNEYSDEELFQIFGHGKVAYTATKNWDSTISSFQESDLEYLLGGYGLYFGIVGDEPEIFWYE